MGTLANFDVKPYKKQKPPKDNSLTTLKEIQDLTKIDRDENLVEKRVKSFFCAMSGPSFLK